MSDVGSGEHNHSDCKPNVIFDKNWLSSAFCAYPIFRRRRRKVVSAAVHNLATRSDQAAIPDCHTFLRMNAGPVDAALRADLKCCSRPICHELDRSSHVEVIAEIAGIQARSIPDPQRRARSNVD